MWEEAEHTKNMQAPPKKPLTVHNPIQVVKSNLADLAANPLVSYYFETTNKDLDVK